MSTKSLVVLVLWVVAIVLFAFVALAIPDTHYNLLAAGLAFAWTGMALNTFWTTA